MRMLAFATTLVAIATAIVLMQRGVAATHEERVLDCHVSGAVAHTHNADCYDAEGNLVCPLVEREAHVHDDSCYTETRELTCALPEHSHTDACYDEEGNLVCGLEEHAHTDACYTVTRELTCGKEEVTETHVHGPGCFRTLTVDDGEPEAASQAQDGPAADASQEDDPAAPDEAVREAAQTFAQEFKDEHGALVLRVDVDAPEGALPEGAAMRAKLVDPAKLTKKQRAAADGATAKKADGAVLAQQAVDISFVDAQGQVVEPTKKVTATFTTPLVNTEDKSVVVHIDDLTEEQVAAQQKALRAGMTADEAEPARSAQPMELLDEAALARRDMSLAADQLAFESDRFSTYVLAVMSLARTMRAEGETMTVTVDAPAKAGIPAGAVVRAHEVAQGTDAYDAYVAQAAGQLGAGARDMALARIFELALEDAEGHALEPAEPVQVQIALADAPTGAQASQLLRFDGQATVVPARESAGTTAFEAAELGTYGVIYTQGFHWAGAGGTYEYRLADGDVIALSDLLVAMGVTGADDAAAYVAGVADVAFADASAGRAARVEASTTAGELKETLGVESAYAAQLTDEQRQRQDDRALADGDWALVLPHSLAGQQALTVTMDNGDQLAILLSDARVVRHELVAEGKTYRVSMTYGDDANIPADATLSVQEIATTTRAYEGYLDQVADTVDEGSVQLARFFDICIMSGGREVHPAAPVQVSITLDDAPEEDFDDTQVVHFAEDAATGADAGMEVVAAQEDAGTSTFDAEGFSVFGVVYTVDFDYDGYKVSMPGDSSVLLSTLARELKLPGAGGKGAFDVAQVKSVAFSDEALVRVTPVEAATTVGALLDGLDEAGVKTWMAQNVVVQTEGMTDEQLLEAAADIEQVEDETKVAAGDWVLTALKAFHSDESLVIALTTGERYVVGVTDLDTKTDGKKPGTIAGVDTASEGITITMFDYGPDKLDQVNNTYKSPDNSGINKGHDLKFYSYGTEGSTINNFTGGAYAMQGVVRSTLGDDGYPVTSTSRGESLAYLFNETADSNNKKVYTNANKLFQRDEDTGNLWYDSDVNYAYMDPSSHEFTLYNDTYLEEGADYANPFRIGFFPYNDYDNRYHCIHGDNFRWGCKGQNDRRVHDQVGHYNHHFGMKVEGNFYMTDDKKTANDQDMIFKFSGDDDMWVFIDGVLVLDIGGIHNPVDGQINFTTGQVTVSAAKTASGGGAYALGTNTTIAKAFEKAGKTWDDSPLSQHDIKIFYMERGGMYSNLAITMNLPTFPHFKHAVLHKVDADNASVALAGAKFELYSDVACTKPIKQEGSENPIIVTSVDGDTTKTVKTDNKGNTENVSLSKGDVLVENLIPGQTYYLKEIEAPEGYKLDNRVFKLVAPSNDNNVNNEAEVYLVNSDGSETKLTTTPPQVTNKKDVYGSVNLKKVNDSTNAGLGGAQFTLYVDADCTQVAKSKSGADLTATSGGNGNVSFGSENIPAGTTYYMKETGTPEDYFPSTDVYRVVLDAEGNAKIYRGATEVSGETAITQIENQPKQQKTSVSVEKRWSDGSANHTGDTVTVQLLETVEETGKTGGIINVTVAVNKWYEDGDETKDATTPTSGSITYQLQKSTDGTTWTNVGSSVTLSPSTWSNTHQNLTEMENDQHVKYRVAKLGKDGAAVKTVEVNGTNEVSEASGTINLKAGVKVGGSNDSDYATLKIKQHGLDFTYSNSNIRIDSYKIYTKESWGLEEQGSWSNNIVRIYQNDTELTFNNIDKHKNEDKAYYVGFQYYPENISGEVYVNGSPSLEKYETSWSAIYYLIPLTQDEITIEFSSTPFSADGTNALGPQSLARGARRAKKATLDAGNIVSSGTYYTDIPATATAVDQTGITNTVTLNENGNGQWAYTWSGLLDTEENVQENGYTFTRKHHYYVKEIEVNLADGTDEDFVVSEYKLEDGKVVITNTVPSKTSLSVTKEWYEQDGKTPDAKHQEITFQVHRVYGDVDEPYGDSRIISYNETGGAYETVTVEGLPTKVNNNGVIEDASYYVVETSPASSDTLITYYKVGDKQYADASDAAGATSETIVNMNASREIKVTKQWFYQKGNQVTEAKEPPEKDVYFKIKQVADSDGAESFYVVGADVPTSDMTPTGYDPVKSSDSNGTIFHLVCTSTTTETPSELDPTKMVSTTTWSWNTLTFSKLPTGSKYYLVETDKDGNGLLSDAIGTKIEYVDENGKTIGATSPIDPSIPGNYTIKNTEHRTSLYAQKVWQGANKDNLAGNEPVWFSLMRVETDGNGNYDLSTLQETPDIGRFSLKESSGWTKYFDSIEVAPPERHSGDTYKYWQYFIVELGLLDDSTKNEADDAKKYRLIDNLFIKYQSKGSGTAADGSTAVGREEFGAYTAGVDGVNDSNTTGSMTVQQWVDKLKADEGTKLKDLLNGNEGIVRLYTWGANYDGMGTLGCFNSSQEFVEKPLKVSKVWKDANGNDLSETEMGIINAESAEGGDRYSVEIQLMQHASVTTDGSYNGKEYDVAYGSTFMINPSEAVMQSDLFEVEKVGEALWEFEIPKITASGENQLPATGPFRIPGTDTTVMANFTYYVSEYSVYDNTGKDVTTLWTAACRKTAGDGTYEYALELENRKTTDLTLHKSWAEVPEESQSWVNDNVEAVLYKVWRNKADAAEADKEDITEWISFRPESYGLTRANVFDVELQEEVEGQTQSIYEDFVRVEKPTAEGGWFASGADPQIKISNLDALVKDHYTEANNLDDWPKYNYWIEEWGYVDADGAYHPISELLHGNTASHPQYQSSTNGTESTPGLATCNPATSCAKVNLGAANATHLGAVNTVRGVELTIVKTDNASTPNALTGAEFTLTKKGSGAFDFVGNNNTQSAQDTKVTNGAFTVSSTSGYTIKNLMPGEYVLTETKAPAGYITLLDPIEFKVQANGTITKTDDTTLPASDAVATNHYSYAAGTTAGKASGTLTVQNEPGKELPAAGGPGTVALTALGVVLMAAGATVIARRRKALAQA